MLPKSFKALRALALIIPVILLTGCSKVSELGFPEGVSSVNDISLSLWQGAWIAAGVVGVITLILILWPAVFHRGKKTGPEFPKQTQYNVPVEIVYTIIPFIIVAVLFYFTATKENQIVAKSTAPVHEISVVGIQWSWQFAYPEAGPRAVVTGTPANPPTLVVPLGERVRYVITSNDVVHGFWIPAFMIQMQNLPGVTNYLEFTANKLGQYPGRCNILCGRAHSQMLFTVNVVTPAEYKLYLETLTGGQA
ncbi:MAG: cytochrome C oxidase subunit II [Actinobacteria bacterium]|uniref:cytochrome-c oxidase n=1 Tax=freshwater metagenome TaxID=449393 RepID=A0A6J7DBS7_9ZZZZ|nr:cytochrome C oxidase subunit II [Actinomycetota bacterium]